MKLRKIEKYKLKILLTYKLCQNSIDMFDNLSFFIYTRGQDPLLQDIYFIKF